MMPKSEIEGFVNHWVAHHVRVLPGHVSLTQEVDRLAATLTGDARAHGISGGDINRAMGDIDDYLTGQLQTMADLPPA